MERMHRLERRKMARLLTLSKGEDRISKLPNEILVSILSRVTLREAALTCFLSKRWRYLWTYISVLNFDVVGNIG
ncbi:hypothetical protein VitviT2T_018901 [Vitis vinifera]|uniref:F-box domain-containing protein n=1 Tax=Vitis vinifera TaxID=29760 RepID=A0ABY9CYW0_VITVI|nr:hypothetical protein VitviT2T_018901 [Vitis vinifera]